MSQTGVINGYRLLKVPDTPGARQIEWRMANVVGKVSNPFTGKIQTTNWQAGWWTATVTMPPMSRIQAGQWLAFLAQCQGQDAVFYFGDDSRKNSFGSALGPGVTAGSFQGGYILTTKNWTPGQFALLSPGDWLQIGYRLYRCLDQPSSDSQGNASFAIWPPIREVPPNGTLITTMGAKGLFRLDTNQPGYADSYDRVTNLSFSIIEALF